MCSSSGTSHLAAQMTLLGGGVQNWILTFGDLPHPMSTSTALWECQLPRRRRALPSLEVSLGARGISPCHRDTWKGVQRLFLHNLSVTTDHFRCHMRFVSLGKVLLASLAVTRMQNGL